jgi:integrase
MLRVAGEVDPRFGLALVLAHETGHRIGAIRQLRWSDVDLRSNRIRWRAENDKLDFEHVTPLTVEAVAALEGERRKRPAVGDAWIFPSPADPSMPCSRNLVRDWWYRAEKLAELDHIEQMGWHSLRRAFGTELKATTNLKDLCALGGWKSPTTILTCYVQADEETMRTALENRKSLGTAAAGS